MPVYSPYLVTLIFGVLLGVLAYYLSYLCISLLPVPCISIGYTLLPCVVCICLLFYGLSIDLSSLYIHTSVNGNIAFLL